MFNTHFGLTENPFHVIPNQKFYFPNPLHERICHELISSIQQHKGLILFSGQTGTGKTLTIRRAMTQLGTEAKCVLYQNHADTRNLLPFIKESLHISTAESPDTVATPAPQKNLQKMLQDIKTIDLDQLLGVVSQDIALPAKSPTKTVRQDPLERYLLKQGRQSRTVAVFIDNINTIDYSAIDALLAINHANRAPDHHKPLQIVVSCSPETCAQLVNHYPEQVTVQCDLQPLENKQIAPYIDHLLRIAGYEGPFPFTRDALRKIAAHSQGIPSLINYLCRSALFTASFEKQQVISPEMIDAAANSYVNQTNDEIMAKAGGTTRRLPPAGQEFDYPPTHTQTAQTTAEPAKARPKKQPIKHASTASSVKSRAKQVAGSSKSSARSARKRLQTLQHHEALKQRKSSAQAHSKPSQKVAETALKTQTRQRKQYSMAADEKPDSSTADTIPKLKQTVQAGATGFIAARQAQPADGTMPPVDLGYDVSTQDSWRMAVYDSLLLFITIGCVVTLYQFSTQNFSKFRNNGLTLESTRAGQQNETLSTLAESVILRIANLEPFDLNLIPSMAVAFLKEEGAKRVETTRDKNSTRTVVEGQFKSSTGETFTRIIEIEPVDTRSRYKGMTTGRADLGFSLNHLNQDTLNTFQDTGDAANTAPTEQIIANTSVAIIVNPKNPVNQLSKEQISSIFEGKIRNWWQLGGKRGGISIHTLGGDHQHLKSILKYSLDGLQLSNTLKTHDTPEQLAEAVAKDMHSIGLVHQSDIGALKALTISENENQPLTQAMHVYDLNSGKNSYVDKFLKFSRSSEAQKILKQNDFQVSHKSKQKPVQQANTDADEFFALTEQAQQLSSNIRFNSTMAILDDVAQRQIDRVTDLLKQLNLEQDKLIILGYCYSSEFANNNLTVSEERAEAVAKAFEDRGIAPAVVKGIGSWHPERTITPKEAREAGDQLPQIQIWTTL